MRVRSSVITASALVIGCAVGATIAPARAAPAASPQAAEEVLADGLDAMAARQVSAARELFEYLIATYPGSAEAGRAALELEAMGAGGAAAQPAAVPGTRSNSTDDVRLVEFRKQFLFNVGDRVFFPENSADLGGRALVVIDRQARWLKKREWLIVTVIGRADDGGASEAQTVLSKKRAEAVRDRLVAGGVAANRVLVDARGPRDPLAICRSPHCQAQNRNAETMIGDPQQAGEPGRLTR